MRVNFIYVRHGQTLFNTISRMQGMCDSPLTKNGIHQAEDTASALRHEKIDHIYCSASERAWDTALILAKYHGIQPVCMKELKEFDFGDLDGKHFEKFKDRIQPHRIADDWTDVNGEDVPLFKERSDRGFEKILSSCKDGDTVLLVSHGSFFMHLMKTIFDYDQQEYIQRMRGQNRPFIPNAGIALFTYEDGKYTLTQEPLSAAEYRNRVKKKVTFYFVRHGETKFNVEKRLQGWCDSPLTKKGKQQAEMAKEALRNVSFAKAYCSTTERTRDTAEIILEPHLMEAIPEKRLKEVFFGSYEGCHYENRWDEIMQRNLKNSWKDADGEDAEEIAFRIRQFFQEAADEAKDGDNILCVSHGDLYMNLLKTFFSLSKEEVYEISNREGVNPMPNAGIFIFTYEDGVYTYDFLMQDPQTIGKS